MAKPYDASPKGLMALRPADWPAFVGVSARSVEVVDADVSTVTAATDKVLLVRAREGDRIQHFDFQSGPDASVPQRAHGYSALLEDRHQLPVDSVVVLLCRKANLKAINGIYERRLPGEAEPYLKFRYRVIGVWQLPVESLLQGGSTLVPLAPLGAVQKKDLPDLIDRMKARLDAEPDQGIVGELWAATKVLMGLRFGAPLIEQLLQGVRGMKESTTYQAIVEEGRAEGRLDEARRMLLRAGEHWFKTPPDAEQRAAILAILEPERLEDLTLRTPTVTSWADLLATPAPEVKPRRSRRKKS